MADKWVPVWRFDLLVDRLGRREKRLLQDEIRQSQRKAQAQQVAVFAGMTYCLGLVLPVWRLNGHPPPPGTAELLREMGPQQAPTFILSLFGGVSLTASAYRWLDRMAELMPFGGWIAREGTTLVLYASLMCAGAFSSAVMLKLDHGRNLLDEALKIAALLWLGVMIMRVAADRSTARTDARYRQWAWDRRHEGWEV